MPLPGTSVVPAGWSAHHQPVSSNAMPDTCVITRTSGTTSWDPLAEIMVPGPPSAVYSGPCRVAQEPRAPREVNAGEEVQTPQELTVALPVAAAPLEGDLVVVTASADPALLVGNLTITEVHQATYRFERTVTCAEV